MWIWIIIGACVIGAIIGFFGSDDKSGADAAGGALAGGCMAASCLARLAIAALIILGTLWLFGVIFS